MNSELWIAAQTIKDTVSAIDVAQAMGWEVRHGRCRCPIHGGKDYNCRLYPGDRGYVCWVCKSGGDVIKLVRDSQQMSFKDAVTWFDSTFSLGINIDSPMDRKALLEAQKKQNERKRERELIARLDTLRFDLYLAADKLLCDLEKMRDETIPTSAYGEWDERFGFAVKMIPEVKRLAEDTLMYCMKGRR